MDLKFKIVYNKGKDNAVADALSRIGNVMNIQATFELQPVWMQEVLNSYKTDQTTQNLLVQLAVSTPNEKGFLLDKGIIKKGSRIWVGANSALQTKIITALHGSAVGGHSGSQGIYKRVKLAFAWKGLKQDVDNFVRQCRICQQAKHNQQYPAGLLQPLPVPRGPWQGISMDFIEGLPISDHCSVIVVVVDRLTKYAHFFPTKHPYTAQSIAQLFLDNVVKHHGMPQTVVTDRDPIFLSRFWKELFKLYEVKLSMSTAYHPQIDGQTKS
jgi:hypothetical protein